MRRFTKDNKRKADPAKSGSKTRDQQEEVERFLEQFDDDDDDDDDDS